MKNTLLINTFLIAATALFSNSVFAQQAKNETPAPQKEILFKIHDVKPNKNEEGFVQDCSFKMTVYNRMDAEIDAASIELAWSDNDGNYVVDQDIVTDENGEQKFDGKMSTNNKVINTFIDIPTVPTYSQVSVDAVAKTEKCFLLLGNMNYRVTSCKLATKDLLGSSAGNTAESCARSFQYVSITDPQYYSEFKPISYAEQETQAEQKKNRDLVNIENKSQEILENFGKTRNILSEIR